ncbi:RNA 2',3'-cyclic phosphodiesterase [Clostridium sp. CF012]|uniref:RNA 2',3'-cyclic phosphodiesterase n=1 Tax=Clostridium sp. CF012 TaxID=2843319 RepID=UPI001C0E6D7E|nr:RNA 2',3'-cyclic phosphodiesterase [Clostridium sp. CF012]MBU3145158.1 RNA 2',3'-cyclic phosphodiesterase [Clostridium sp. CF012]
MFYRRLIKIRIFIAIDFEKSIKSYLLHIKNKLERYFTKGRLTDIDNFHLTLQYIGELEESNIPKLLNALQECASKHDPFSITLDTLGSFKKGDSNILWIGINNSEDLMRIYEELCITLKREKIAFDEKPLKPHITLGRNIILKKPIDELENLISIENVIIPINNITLMESKRIDGKLVNIPVATLSLKH